MRTKDIRGRGRLKTLIPLAALILSGCGASEVMQAGPSTYRVSAKEGALTGGWPEAQKDALAKANQHCASMGQHFTMVNESQAGTPGFTPLTSTITFTCGVDLAAVTQAVVARCASELRSPELQPLRGKIELDRPSSDRPPPFEIISNETFPSSADRLLIAKWATVRDRCLQEQIDLPQPAGMTALTTARYQQIKAFGTEMAGRIGDLILALYDDKMTFGEFAQKRYEIGKDGAAAQRQFLAATLQADQQAAQQQLQTNLLAWSAYMQGVNARQPQTIRVQGTVGLQTHCMSSKVGDFVNTNCN
jgi:hypothetical protein